MCVRASMKAAKPLHIVLATNPRPDPKPDSISGPAGSGRVADLYPEDQILNSTPVTLKCNIDLGKSFRKYIRLIFILSRA